VTSTVEIPLDVSAVLDEPIARGRGAELLRFAVPVAVGLVTIGVALRFWTLSDLWLDEALSVNIAKLPLHQIPGALRHDGAPPLYYFLLHGWMSAFGDGDFAVRSLSGLISVATLPFMWTAGKRLGGRACAWATLVLMATSPFAITYATATRMYALMMLWSLLGFLALVRAIEQPTRVRLAAVAVMTALIIYTHYWGLYFVAAAAAWLFFRSRRGEANGSRSAGEEQQVSRRVLGAMVIGGLTFLPWLPSFIFQSLHTGTPWSNAAGPGDVLGVLGEYSGGGPWGAALALLLFTLFLLGLFGRAIDSQRVLLHLRTRRRVRPVAWVFAGTLTFAVLAGAIAQAAFVGRYTAVVFPLFILLGGLGACVFLDRRVMAGVLTVTALFGLIVGIGANATDRTQAGSVASVINKDANPGDLVVYCPDQLGPAAARLIHAPVDQATFPHATPPQRVNWVDYRQVIADTDVVQFGQDMVSRAGGGHALWYVWANYAGTDHKCDTLLNLFQALRPNGIFRVHATHNTSYEYDNLVRFPG
jgi:mannosyltransferase